MAQIPKGWLVKGPYKPICSDCAIYFSTTVIAGMLTLGGVKSSKTFASCLHDVRFATTLRDSMMLIFTEKFD